MGDQFIYDALDALRGGEEESVLRLSPVPAPGGEERTAEAPQALGDPSVRSDRNPPGVERESSRDGSSATGRRRIAPFEALVAIASSRAEGVAAPFDVGAEPVADTEASEGRWGPCWTKYYWDHWDCVHCFLLREIVHVDEYCSMKLRIHGPDAFTFKHGILHIQYVAEGTKDSFYIAEFSQYDQRSVNMFLRDYISNRQQFGQRVARDAVYTYFDVFSIPGEEEPLLRPSPRASPLRNPRFSQRNVLDAAEASQLQPALPAVRSPGFVESRSRLHGLGFRMGTDGNPAAPSYFMPVVSPPQSPHPVESGEEETGQRGGEESTEDGERRSPNQEAPPNVAAEPSKRLKKGDDDGIEEPVIIIDD